MNNEVIIKFDKYSEHIIQELIKILESFVTQCTAIKTKLEKLEVKLNNNDQ